MRLSRIIEWFERRPKFIFLMLFLPVAAISNAFILTGGSYHFDTLEPFGRVFIEMLDRFKSLEFNVSYENILYEGYVRDGKVYPYFGIFPAWFRGAIEIFFYRQGRDWSRVSCLIASLLTCAGLGLVFFDECWKTSFSLKIKTALISIFMASLLWSSPMTQLLYSADIYNECILWACAWTSIAIWILHQNQMRIDSRVFVRLVICGAFAVLSKPTISLFLVLFLMILFAEGLWWTNIKQKWFRFSTLDIPLRPWGYTTLVPVIACTTISWVNYERWGNPFTFLPLKWNIAIQKNQYDKVIDQHGVFNIRRIPASFEYYFIPTSDNFINHSPLFLRASNVWGLQETLHKYDYYVEKNRIPITLNSFFFCVLSIVGFWASRKRMLSTPMGVMFGLSFSGVFLILCFGAVTQRYQSEFLFPMILGSVFAIRYLEENKKYIKLFMSALSLLMVLSVMGGLSCIVLLKVLSPYIDPVSRNNLIQSIESVHSKFSF